LHPLFNEQNTVVLCLFDRAFSTSIFFNDVFGDFLFSSVNSPFFPLAFSAATRYLIFMRFYASP